MSPFIILPIDSPPDYASTVLADSPVAYWRMGDSAGTTLTDEQASYNAPLTGTYTLGATGLINNDPDTSVNFNGGQAVVAHGGWATPTMSIECWVKPTSVSGTTVCLSLPFGFSANCLEVGPSSGTWIGRVRTGGSLWTQSGGPTPAVGVTFHLVVTTDGSFMNLYVNGSPVGPVGISPGNVEINEGNIHIGRVSGFGQNFLGDIDEVAIYLSALSPTRVLAHYNAGI